VPFPFICFSLERLWHALWPMAISATPVVKFLSGTRTRSSEHSELELFTFSITWFLFNRIRTTILCPMAMPVVWFAIGS